MPYSIHLLHISRVTLYSLPHTYLSCHLIYVVFLTSVPSHMLSPLHRSHTSFPVQAFFSSEVNNCLIVSFVWFSIYRLLIFLQCPNVSHHMLMNNVFFMLKHLSSIFLSCSWRLLPSPLLWPGCFLEVLGHPSLPHYHFPCFFSLQNFLSYLFHFLVLVPCLAKGQLPAS